MCLGDGGSPRPYSPPVTRGRRAREAASSDRLPTDVLFNVLLRFPARDLCRLRAVCRAWRSLTVDPVFIKEHAARHPGPFFLAQLRDDKTHSVYIVDLSGNVVKRMAGAAGGPYHRLQCMRLDLACLTTDWNRCHVLNPATGAVVQALPESPAAEHVNRVNLRDPYTFFSLGRVSSTGDYKVFRMFNRVGFAKGGEQLFEVFTINGGAEGARWRGQQSPGLFIDECSGVVVDGMVYFLTSRVYDGARNGIRPDYIVSFDLGREEWRRDLRGPISSSVGSASGYTRHHLALAELKGSLVLADRRQPLTVDLWFLVDFGSGHWVKESHILTGPAIERPVPVDESFKPLLLLDDGRLVVYIATKGQLFIREPGTHNFEKVYMGLSSVSVYTGNLLSRG